MPLTHGWLPITLQVLAVIVLAVAIGRRTRRWLQLWVPAALLFGVVSAVAVHWYIGYQGWAQDPAPAMFWLWIALTGVTAAVVVLGWRGIRWWRRGVSVLAVALCMLCVGVGLNMWVGYFPTVHSAWNRATGTGGPQWVDEATVATMQRDGARPSQGVVVSAEIPGDASGFPHRTEYIYLPPRWFEPAPPPRLPVVMMIGAEFGRPDDWLHSGDVLKTVDRFTATHDGNGPVVVFVDSSGTFMNDTECVNGTRGNAADHLTKDVVPYMISHFGVSPDPANWGVAGWSAGGTCALTLNVMHPELFSAFVDIDGQYGPNAGTKQQTIARLFGGDADAWSAFDPKTVITRHGMYSGMAGWFAVSAETSTVYRAGSQTPAPAPQSDWDTNADDYAVVANNLCESVSGHGVECAVVSYDGSHDFPSAGSAFAEALPWLAGKIGTPGVPRRPMPGASPAE